MAEERPRPRGQHRRHPPSLPIDPAIADFVDAGVNAMEGASRHPSLDGPPSHPKLEQLSTTHNAMLPSRQLGDAGVPRSRRQISPCEEAFRRFDLHATEAEANERACGAQIVPILCRGGHEKGPNPPLPPLALIPSNEGGCLLLPPRGPETFQLPCRLCWVKR